MPKRNHLIQQYIDSAIEHGKCTLNDNYKKGNRAHDRIIKSVDLIKVASLETKLQFTETLEHYDDSVKTWTATSLLATLEKKSINVLKRIAEQNKSVLGFNAEMVLDSWKKGTLEGITKWDL